MSLVWWLTLALLKWAVLSENKAIIGLVVIVAVLVTAIWAVEWRDRGTSATPVKPIKASAKALKKPTPEAKAPVKVKAKAKVKHVSRSRSRAFTAPSSGSNRRIGKRLAAEHGWTGEEWVCLNNLWTKESGWSTRSSNSSGSAWGIPQALPGSKMRSAGTDWRTNPATQIKWGIGYIDNRYGTACNAWAHWQSHNWY